MKEIKKFIETKYEMEMISHSQEDVDYLITPMFIIIKYNKKYAISFSIDLSKTISFDFYIDFGHHFLDKIDFAIYEDSLVKYNTFSYNIEYFCFGDQAKQIYFDEIFKDITNQASIPKDAVFN